MIVGTRLDQRVQNQKDQKDQKGQKDQKDFLRIKRLEHWYFLANFTGNFYSEIEFG